MNLKYFIYFFLIFISSCVTPKAKLVGIHPALSKMRGRNFTEDKLLIVSNDLDYLSKEKTFAEFMQFMNQDQLTLDYSDTNCRSDQLSCFYPNYSRTIFINHKFFKLNRIERIGTLLHELHHLFHYVPHVPCPLDRRPFTDCDYNFSGAYGVELRFYQLAKEALKDCDASDAYLVNIKRIIKNRF
jgi:hypothetical protein